MSAAVLTDFGSTVCKVTVVDLADARVLGHGEAPTYLTGDVMDAYDIAYERRGRPAGEATTGDALPSGF